MAANRLEAELNLRHGEVVEVRSEEEILSTLDTEGCLDTLPFMPEMLEFCGRRFKVYKRADKTCDTISNTGSRRMWRTVHLEDLRCHGHAHGGCQARCLLFWKEAWLKRVQPGLWQRKSDQLRGLFSRSSQSDSRHGTFSGEDLTRATRVANQNCPVDDETYRCQATELVKASATLPWWDIRQYLRGVWTGDVSMGELAAGIFFRVFHKIASWGMGTRALVWSYNSAQRALGGTPYPFRSGGLMKTPSEALNLQPGELVQIKSHDEILETLDQNNKNRGLFFDVEMAPYCNGKFRVLQRIERIINEKTGKMTKLPGGCIMLEGVTCKSLYSDRRIACPRSIYSYWREIWLRRVE